MRDSLEKRLDEFGPIVMNTLIHLGRNYGDDVLEAVFERIKARREAKVDAHGERAIDKIEDAAARRLEHIKAGNTGDGHE